MTKKFYMTGKNYTPINLPLVRYNLPLARKIPLFVKKSLVRKNYYCCLCFSISDGLFAGVPSVAILKKPPKSRIAAIMIKAATLIKAQMTPL